MLVKRVLVADDDRTIRQLLVEFLGSQGFDVYSATNGREAINQAKKVQPDCILMDLNMPVLDGVEAIRRIKRDPETASIQIYAMSANSTIRQHNKDIIVDGTLEKPFDLLAVLDTVLDGAMH